MPKPDSTKLSSLSKIFKEDKARIVGLRKGFWDGACAYKAMEYECDYEHINDSQFRISKDNKVIDVFPVGFKYHKIHSDQRGTVEDIEKFMDENFGPNAKDYYPSLHKKKKGKKSGGKRGLTLDSQMPIGKYKGTRIRDLNRAYLKYIYEMEYSSKEVLKLIKDNYDDLF